MFLIHGQYNLEAELGVVADRCGVCDELNVIRVTRLTRKFHFYFIPIGPSTFLGTAYTCAGCKGKTNVERHYDRIVPEKEARSMSLEQILQETNARLAKDMACRMRLEREAEVAETTPGGPDARVELAIAKVAELNDEATALRFQSLLDSWEALDAASRLNLLQGLDAALDSQKRRATHKNFLNIVSQQFQSQAGCFQGIATFAVVLIAGCMFSLKLFGRNGLATGFVFSLIAAAMVAVLVYWRWNRHARKQFFRRIFLPELDNRRIEVGSITTLLGQIEVDDHRVDESLRAMAKALPLLKEVLAEQDRYLEMPNDEHAEPADSR